MNYLYLALVSGVLCLSSCGGFQHFDKKEALTVTPAKLELVVDQNTDPYTVPVKFDIDVPSHYVPSCARLVITPRFVGEGNEHAFSPIIIQGKKYTEMEQRLLYLQEAVQDYPNVKRYLSTREKMQIQVDEKVPFQIWMLNAKFVLTSVLETCNKTHSIPEHLLADGVIYIPLGPGPVRVKYVRTVETRKEEGFTRLFYPVNGYTIDTLLFQNREQLAEMTTLIRNTLSDTSARIDRIVVTGICSPDGAWKFNEMLARERANSVKDYLVHELGIDASLITTQYIAEDWRGLVKLIDVSDMANKEQVLGVINRVDNDDQREVALRKLPQYKYIKQTLYPQLRKVTYEIYYTVEEVKETVEPT
ncbi:hypothetical protein [Gabonibacter chumensis]|uniref:hypothetical protein n=1 Tax=Gabonibacter chumensis TaxID=2972474 RepID=UPI002573F9B6|nr:hypothetical protein [Gabonibacter chumensis]MCR9011218.1 hypothetical protein [Gabonibacter chumensis]